MNSFTVTITLPNEKAFLKFLDDVGPVANQMMLTMEKQPDEVMGAPAYRPSKTAPARQRVSKVNEAILDALTFKDCNVRELKEALEKAGKSSGSLSTGLAALQKSGQVVRHGDGVYGLAQGPQAKAAE